MVRVHKAEVNAAEGSTVDLHCTVNASPAARIRWTRAGHVLNDDNKHKIHVHPHKLHHHNMTTLRVRDVNKDDLGQYECHAENSLGKSVATVTLIYEPEEAILIDCKLSDDNFQTVTCNWTVHSAQPLSEANLFYKDNGDRKWQQNAEPCIIRKEEENKWT